MKKIIIIAIVLSSSLQAFACDICGCGVGGYYLGLLPDFRKRFLGFRYQQNGLYSHLGPNGETTYLTAREAYRMVELWGATNIGKRFRISVSVPYNLLERETEEAKFSSNGIGDLSLIGYYRLLNTTHTTGNNKLLVQSLWIGAGVKLPTGKYKEEEKELLEAEQNTFQLGTGSTDFSVHVMYDIRLQDAGINANISYKLNTRNRFDYKYGDKFSLNLLGYYKFRVAKNISITPNTGVLYERAQKDEEVKGLKVFETGGHSTMGTVGVEIALNRVGIGANFQSPLNQHLAEGRVKARDRGMAYVSFAF